MDTRVSKLANIVDDKTIIAKLILEKSDRIRLIEFKDARADIWQFFRLVCLDGITLPYAVCVRCMKPVSYKAREGTGGLHRHPCSKQAIAAALAAGIPFGSSSNRSAKVSQMSRTGSHSGNSSKSHSSTTASTSLVSIPNKIDSNFKPNFTFNSLAAIEMVNNLAKNSHNLAQNLIGSAFAQQSFGSHQRRMSLMSEQMEENSGFSEDLLTLNILKLFCTELLPLEVLENGSFIELVQQLINFGAINGSINFERIQVNSLLTTAYETSRLDFKSLLQSLSFITFVIDLWSQEITKRQFMTVWAHLGNSHQNNMFCKIVVTKDISHISSSEQLIKQIDFIRKDITDSNSEFIYLFDNDFFGLNIEANDNFLFCVSHQLNRILDEIHSIPEFCQIFNEIKIITNIMENIDGFGLKFVTQGISNFNNWFQVLKIFKLLKEFPNLKQILSEKELRYVGKSCFDEITDFLVPFAEALNYFHFESDKTITTINLISLWRVKLENHCKSKDNDSTLMKTIKEKLRNAILKSNLNHPIFLMAVCFDPRFKKLKMFSEEMRTKTYDIIRRQMTHFCIKQEPQQYSQQSSSSEQTFSESLSDVNSSNDSESQRKKFKAIEDKTAEAFNEYLDETNEEEKDELQRYLELDVGQTQPLEFWCGEPSNRLPRLRSLAQRILSIPPVLSKCCHYSTSGEQLSIRRKSLDSRYLDKVLVLNSHFSSI